MILGSSWVLSYSLSGASLFSKQYYSWSSTKHSSLSLQQQHMVSLKMLSQGCSGDQNRSVISQTVLSKLLIRAGRNIVNVCAVCFLLAAQVVGKPKSCLKAFAVNNLLLH